VVQDGTAAIAGDAPRPTTAALTIAVSITTARLMI
jgi:hypothetical protein